jgi:hypothetical protein
MAGSKREIEKNTKQDQFQENGETDQQCFSGIKDKLQRKLKYADSSLQFGFTCVGDSNAPYARSHYVTRVWETVSKLQLHLCTLHIDFNNKPITFEKCKCD